MPSPVRLESGTRTIQKYLEDNNAIFVAGQNYKEKILFVYEGEFYKMDAVGDNTFLVYTNNDAERKRNRLASLFQDMEIIGNHNFIKVQL
jgi:negative regulator of replication initiation